MIGKRIAELRKEKGMTQEELAKALNITRSALSLYEIGKRDPDTDTIKKFAEFFGVSTDYLLGQTDVRDRRTRYIQPQNNKIDSANSPQLTRKDEREIEKILDEVRKQLENAEGLMFDGEPASPEAIQSILDSMRIGLEIAKQRNKQKYTPKKYRKNKKEVGESE